jgi:hypothetical protein
MLKLFRSILLNIGATGFNHSIMGCLQGFDDEIIVGEKITCKIIPTIPLTPLQKQFQINMKEITSYLSRFYKNIKMSHNSYSIFQLR